MNQTNKTGGIKMAKKIKDFGEKIGGARKDMFRKDGLREDDIRDL